LNGSYDSQAQAVSAYQQLAQLVLQQYSSRFGVQAERMPPPRQVDAGKFPTGIVIVLSLCMTLNTYSVGSLFSYVGVMVKHLLELRSTNESGEKVCTRYNVQPYACRVYCCCSGYFCRQQDFATIFLFLAEFLMLALCVVLLQLQQ